MLDFTDALRVVPEPETAEGQQHQAQRGEGGVGRFDGISIGAHEAVKDGAIVNLLDEVVPAFLGTEDLAGGEVDLHFGVVIDEDDFDDALAGPYVEPFDFIPEAEAVVGEAEGESLDAIHRKPLTGIGADSFLGGRSEVGLFFPAEQYPGETDNEHENEKRYCKPFVKAAVGSGGTGYFFRFTSKWQILTN